MVGIVASLVSAFHGGAELVKLYKKRRAKKREKRQQNERELQAAEAQDHVLQDMLYASMEEGETAISRRFMDEQRALGAYGQRLRSGDDRAKQELLMIVVSLQAEVIASIGREQQNMQVILEMAQLKSLHEATIMKRHEAIRSIGELRQRIEVTLPISRLSVDSALGVSLSRRNSSESLAKTFVTAAANLYITEPSAQRLLTVPPMPGRQQSQRRPAPSPSLANLSSYQDLIPEIRAQDIDALTVTGEPSEYRTAHDTIASASMTVPGLTAATDDSASSSSPDPEIDFLAHRLETVGPYFPPRTLSADMAWLGRDRFASLDATQTHSTMGTAPGIIRAISTPDQTTLNTATALGPDTDMSSNLHPDDRRPYCVGALAAQSNFQTGFTCLELPILPGSQKLHPSWKCNACDFNASDGDGKLMQRIEFAHGVRYRFPLCARSHAPYKQPADAFRPRYAYGCLFCTAEGRTSARHEGSDALMAHIAAKHRTNLTPECRARTHSIIGRLAGRDEGWDVNLPDVTSKNVSGFGRFVLHAVTSLPT